jgi:uncharacterized protein (TIGR02588 family)
MFSAPEQSAKQEEKRSTTPLAEWLVGLVGLLLVLGVVGFLIVQAQQPATPPTLVVVAEPVIAQAGGYLVPIRVTNEGGRTASTVLIEGSLLTSDDPAVPPVETSETTFDFVPPQSSRDGGLFFAEDPAQYQLELQVKGFIEP